MLVLDEPINHIAPAAELEAALGRHRGRSWSSRTTAGFRARFTGDRLEIRPDRVVAARGAYAPGPGRPPRT